MTGFAERLKTSPYLKTLPTRTDFAIYHSLFGGLCIADRPALELLRRFERPTTIEQVFELEPHSKKSVSRFVGFLKSRSFLVDPAEEDEYQAIQRVSEDREAGLKQGKALKIIQLIVTNDCNFRCKYCFTRSIYAYPERISMQDDPQNKTMSPEDARQYIREIIKLLTQAGTPTLMIQFFGGEPLMNWLAVSSVLEDFRDGKAYGIQILYSIVTNGSMITGTIADMLFRFQVAVLLSFDSPRGEDRIMANGKNGTKAVAKSLDLLKAAKVNVAFNSVLSNQTFDYFGNDLIDYACEYGVGEIGVILDLDPDFYTRHPCEKIVEKLLGVHDYGKSSGVIVTGYWHQILQQMYGFRRVEQMGFKTCSATGCQFSVEPNGSVFACKGSSGYFGNVRDMTSLLSSKNWKAYSMRAFKTARECRGCEIENFCSGFCLGPLEKKYHDIYVVEPPTCQVYKKLVRGLIQNIRKYEIETLCML